jgi:UDP-3-O-[3-hydroxymyristoyl] glucosamine N-acyltransferase
MNSASSLTAGELAHALDGTLHGDAARRITEVATLEDAGPEHLSWVGHPNQAPRLAASDAGVVLLPGSVPVPAGRPVIVVADPDLALCDVLRRFAPPTVLVPLGVHPSACVAPDAVVTGAAIGPHVTVGPGATIGPRTQLHAGVFIGDGCVVGADCVLWPNVVLREHATLGERVIIHPNATIGGDGFGYHQRAGRNVKIPQIGRVVIEDDVEIGANSCIDRARSGVTRIRRGAKIDNLVQIGHNVEIGEDCILAAQCGVSGSTVLGDHVMLGGQVGLIDHLKIGRRVMVVAQSGISNDVEEGKVVRGTPAVDGVQACREVVSVRRLPKLMEQVRTLVKRVEQLESAANDRT